MNVSLYSCCIILFVFTFIMTKYRISFSFLLFILVLFGSAYAQVQRTTNLGDVVLRFCNDPAVTWWVKSLVLDTEPEKQSDVCMLISNGGPTKTKISLNFVDGTITADEDQKKACEPENTKTNFGQYVTDYPTSIEIAAGETVKVWAKVTFPAWYAGTAYGCATFQVIDDGSGSATKKPDQMFTILTRRASFLDFNVKWDYIVDLQSQDASMEWSFPSFSSKEISVVDSLLIPRHNFEEALSQKNPFALRLGKNLTTRSVVVNNGNVWLDLTVVSHYRAWWWLIDMDQGSQAQKLVPKQRKTLEFDTNKLAWWLGGPTEVTHTITYKPIIIGSGLDLDPSLLVPKTMVLSSVWIVTARVGWWCAGVVLFILLWYIVYLVNRHNRSSRRSWSKKSFK